MGSKYPPSVRGCLPLWTLTLEVAFILVFCFFMDYDSSSKDHKALMGTYGAIFQDVTVMAALGLGFLTSSLWKQGWSSVAFNLFMLALGVQWSVLLNGFLNQNMVITLSSMQQATMSSMSPLISVGAVLGKVNLVQLVVMTLMEVTVFDTMRMVSKKFLHIPDYINMMYIHVFAACFGLTVAWHVTKPLPKGAQKKDQMARSPSLFAMLGTLFLWIFWPSFNSALLHSLPDRKIAVFNTYYALAVSTVTAISLSALAHPQGKINMAYIHNAVLAGGVAVGAPSHLIDSPWIAMVLGLITGLMSSMETKSLPEHFNHVMWTHDTCGVGYTFGLPGVLGGITNIILAVYHTRNHDLVFMNFGALSLSLFMGMVSGSLTGLLLKLKIWRAVPPVAKYFHDQAFWEFPHLAVGF